MSNRSSATELWRGYAEGHRKKEKIAKLAASLCLGFALSRGLNALEDVRDAANLYFLSRDVDQLADRIADSDEVLEAEYLAQLGYDTAKERSKDAVVEGIIGTAYGVLVYNRVQKARSERDSQRYLVDSAREYKELFNRLDASKLYVPSGPVVPGERATYGPPLLSQAPPNEGC